MPLLLLQVSLRDILHAAESMKQQVRQSLDWRQEQEAQLLDQIEKGQGSAEDVGEDDKAIDSEEPDLNSWM
jgi:pantothenate kinase-related protein Tda10